MDIQKEIQEALTILTISRKDQLEDFTTIVSHVDEGHENMILDLSEINSLCDKTSITLELIQNSRDNIDKSLVICGVDKSLQSNLEEKFGKDFFNIVPTRNEAVDMVYMEEQERSFFN